MFGFDPVGGLGEKLRPGEETRQRGRVERPEWGPFTYMGPESGGFVTQKGRTLPEKGCVGEGVQKVGGLDE